MVHKEFRPRLILWALLYAPAIPPDIHDLPAGEETEDSTSLSMLMNLVSFGVGRVKAGLGMSLNTGEVATTAGTYLQKVMAIPRLENGVEAVVNTSSTCHFAGATPFWRGALEDGACSYHDATKPLKIVHKPKIPSSLAGFMVTLLGTEARVWGRALAETFDWTPVMDTELNEVHLAAQQTILHNSLEPFVRWALWGVELYHVNALGIPPVANLVAPMSQWVDIYFYPSNEVAEVLEA